MLILTCLGVVLSWTMLLVLVVFSHVVLMCETVQRSREAFECWRIYKCFYNCDPLCKKQPYSRGE